MAFTRLFRFPEGVTGDLRSNFLHYYGDIGWWGLYAGGTMAFVNIYAARCGATPTQIGWLAAGPALLVLLLSLPAGRLVSRFPASRVTVVTSAIARSLFLVYPLIPWLAPHHQVEALLALVMILTIPNSALGISFSKLFMEALPLEWRGNIVGARNAILAVVSFATTVAAGQILTAFAFPVGYQIVFAIGFVGAIMTSYHLSRVKPLVVEDPADQAVERPSARPRLVVDGAGRKYIKVIVVLFFLNAINSMATPVIPEILVRALKLSDAMISIGTASSSLLLFGVSLFIARAMRRLGNRWGTGISALLLGGQLAALAFAHGPGMYLLSVVIGGIGTGIQSTAQYNYHLENVPVDSRATWLSWNQMLGNAAILLGSLVGPLVAQQTSAPASLLVFGALRLVLGWFILSRG